MFVSLCDGRIVRHSSLSSLLFSMEIIQILELFSHVSQIDPWSRMSFSITTSAQVHRLVCIQWRSSENYTLNETSFEDIFHCFGVSEYMCVCDSVIKHFLISRPHIVPNARTNISISNEQKWMRLTPFYLMPPLFRNRIYFTYIKTSRNDFHETKTNSVLIHSTMSQQGVHIKIFGAFSTQLIGACNEKRLKIS